MAPKDKKGPSENGGLRIRTDQGDDASVEASAPGAKTPSPAEPAQPQTPTQAEPDPTPQVREGELGTVFGIAASPPLVLSTKATAFGEGLLRGDGAGGPGRSRRSERALVFHAAGRRFRLRISALSGFRAYLLAALLGLFTAATMAPFHVVPLLPLALTGLVWLLDGTETGGKGLRQAFGLGWFFGFPFFLAGVYWVGYSFLVEAETYAWMLPFAVTAMPVGLALFAGAGVMLAKAFWRPGPVRILIFAAAFALLEFARGILFTGFPWNLTGYAFGGSMEIMQSLSVIGIYGLGFLAILFAASPAALFAHEREGANWRWPVLAMAAVIALWGAGAMRLATAESGGERFVDGVNVRIVQPNIPQADKWLPENRQPIWDRLLAQTAASSDAPITHVIWPESAVPFVLAAEPERRAEAGGVLGDGAILMTGAMRVEREPGGGVRLYNGFHVMDSAGIILGTYDKHHLVPFGEYLPFRPILSRLGFRALVDQRYDYAPGPGPRTLSVPGAPDIGPLVCYEAIFPSQIVDERRRPGWLVNVTDDSWFGTSTGPHQHLGFAQARAIEEGLPLFRAANTGVSAVIDPYGRVLTRLGLNSFGVIDSPLPEALSSTPYSWFRDWPFLVVVLGVLGLAARRTSAVTAKRA